MHLHRNFVWTLSLSERELRVVIKALKSAELTSEEQSLADKVADAMAENAIRLERISSGRRHNR